ncbi:MAG: beta-Ala-His dipeptidase [Lachnospiraceae bacterium]|nr:beta-Ala-His dipeptidase [Lachnospiraceae bacterium]
MEALKGLAPEKVFRFFEELCGIPHGSYHIDKISDHLAAFAKERGFSCIQDKEKNIIVYLPATEGYEEEPVLILQGHMDMVAVHDDPAVDMKSAPVSVMHDDAWVFARHSSLGGDDGIAVAYMMAIMDDPSIAHPALELLITTNEEVGMEGAVGLDAKLLRGKRLLNLDSEDEGIFTAGCAGGVRVVAALDPAEAVQEETAVTDGAAKKGGNVEGIVWSVEVNGLQGGHSGQMIHLGRANANHVLARVLLEAGDRFSVGLNNFEGGTACNAIPTAARMEIVLPAGKQEAFADWLEEKEKQLRHEFRGKDDALNISAVKGKEGVSVYTPVQTGQAARFLVAEPDGVQAMSGLVKGLVETSLNCGIVRFEEGRLRAYYELRSMIGSAAMALKDRVVAIAEAFGARAEVSASYPEWEYREVSPLREKMISIYRELYGKEPVVDVIHAGLECGVLAKKIDGFDAVSIGPDMRDIHTTKERLSIESVRRTWEFLLEILKRR